MELIIFLIVMFTFMFIEDWNIKKDVRKSAKSPFTKKDAEKYYNEYLN